MEYTFETTYDLDALTAMTKALRKTVRRKKSSRSHIFGWILVWLVVLLSLPRGEAYVIDPQRIVTWLAAAAIVVALLFEDKLNALIVKKRMLPGLLTSTATFAPEGYSSVTEVGSSEFSYDNILALAETERYFIFIFSPSHAQVYDKSSILGGSCEDFAAFITCTTQKTIQKV